MRTSGTGRPILVAIDSALFAALSATAPRVTDAFKSGFAAGVDPGGDFVAGAGVPGCCAPPAGAGVFGASVDWAGTAVVVDGVGTGVVAVCARSAPRAATTKRT